MSSPAPSSAPASPVTSSPLAAGHVAHMHANVVVELLAQPEKIDYSEEVRQLAQNKIWSSVPPESYTPNGKINFLHLNNDGVFVLTVFKPNTKPRRIYAKINPEEVEAVRAQLQSMENWDKVDEKGWDNKNSEGDVDGNTYMAHRKITLGENGFEAHWIVSHKNVGKQVLVADKLLIARDGQIQPEEESEDVLD